MLKSCAIVSVTTDNNLIIVREDTNNGAGFAIKLSLKLYTEICSI